MINFFSLIYRSFFFTINFFYDERSKFFVCRFTDKCAIKNRCRPLNTCGFASFAFSFIRQKLFSMLSIPAAKKLLLAQLEREHS